MHDDPLKTAAHILRSSLEKVAHTRMTQVQATESVTGSKAAIEASRLLLARADKLLFEWRDLEDS